MIYPAAIVYALLYYSRIMLISTKKFIHGMLHPMRTLQNFDDPFSRRVRRYKEVPEWWFMVIFVGSIAMAIGVVEGYRDTQTPVWTIFMAIVINLLFILPFGYLYATTALQFDVNVLIELVIGYALPGHGTANMITKTIATNFMSQTENYVTNQKQSHYCGIAPRSLFRIQILSVILSSFASIGILWFQLTGGVADMCSQTQIDKFTCANTRTFFSASVIWAVIGPKRVFNTLYPAMKYCFLIGAILPIPFYLANRYGPRWTRNFNVLVLISGPINWAPYNFMYYTPNFYCGFIFNYWIRRRYATWWQKYNYLLYAALGAGLAWSAFIMFFATEYNHQAAVNWWGNNVPYAGLDAAYPALITPGVNQTFGPGGTLG
jgi:OPT family small oligopeptide transporter